ncbi:MAG: CPBP family intramembrane metalloprotease [Anaerolineales bacterium]|nr:MAG: CPBP family intramembrane metalloprotease [Anaerolineales bacterium]
MEDSDSVIERDELEPSPKVAVHPVPWSKRDMLWAVMLGLGVVLALVVVLVVGLQLLSSATDISFSPGWFGTVVLMAELGLLLPVWALGVLKYRVPWGTVGFRRFDLLRGTGLGCLFLFGALGCNVLWAIALAFFDLRAQPDVLPLFGGGTSGLLMALLAGGLVAPIAEEAFFRGYLFAGLRQHLGRLPGIVLSSALFAVLHILPTSWPPIFLLGMLFAVLYEQTGSIWPAVFVHGTINALSFLSSYLFQVVGG